MKWFSREKDSTDGEESSNPTLNYSKMMEEAQSSSIHFPSVEAEVREALQPYVVGAQAVAEAASSEVHSFQVDEMVKNASDLLAADRYSRFGSRMRQSPEAGQTLENLARSMARVKGEEKGSVRGGGESVTTNGDIFWTAGSEPSTEEGALATNKKFEQLSLALTFLLAMTGESKVETTIEHVPYPIAAELNNAGRNPEGRQQNHSAITINIGLDRAIVVRATKIYTDKNRLMSEMHYDASVISIIDLDARNQKITNLNDVKSRKVEQDNNGNDII